MQARTHSGTCTDGCRHLHRRVRAHACRYERVDRARAGRVWSEAFEAAAQKRSGAGVRVRVLYLVSGLVLPVWQEVKRVLAAQPRPADRRLSVIRLETSGAQRFCAGWDQCNTPLADPNG